VKGGVVKTLSLNRIAQSELGTFGVLIEGQIPFALTLEPPWHGNQKNISCIPPGKYQCVSVNSPRFGYTFEVNNVPNRSHILFHCGNMGRDTHGCILVGEQFEPLNGEPAILASKAGYKEFMFRMKGEEIFNLMIRECWPGAGL